jgi:pyruvate/2-oxoglutarate dehydrogenase complex dihydrolipoamide acyltransferase (E2) component
MPATEVRVPDIGDFEKVEVIEVLVKAGDRIAAEQSLVTVESDKASMEIPSSSAGVVKEMRVAVGDKVSEGTLLLVLEGECAQQPRRRRLCTAAAPPPSACTAAASARERTAAQAPRRRACGDRRLRHRAAAQPGRASLGTLAAASAPPPPLSARRVVAPRSVVWPEHRDFDEVSVIEVLSRR